MDSEDPIAVAVTAAIRSGDLPRLRELLGAHPALARATLVRTGAAAGGRSLLHIVTDWPGHPPRGPEVIRLLVEAGADPTARFVGAHAETPLHWAASNDDVAAIDALIDCGAEVEAGGGIIGGGTPLSDARAFGQWRAARRLLEHGAHADFQDAASLGLLDRIEAFLAAPTPPGPDEITAAFWGACHGGSLAAARYLLAHGADLDWIGYDGLTPLDIARSQDADGAREVTAWLLERGAHPAADLIE
ncbi:ankyrin repeat domain-containing protein [Streptomyces sp. NBC_00536]|uniref:ankyrin repeat domain-containing protein n=1 Tax=Streptomyces sp. NBC_00536 TaxID=2975769 RepID=UPI002E81E54E|nr:ankyrin repeat domain-containing protein [Streptomyces sp. NBC_00536]WUC82641.1 ankyrin repeat domain-containing protein [Streptomyces sp. NBC_00536]